MEGLVVEKKDIGHMLRRLFSELPGCDWVNDKDGQRIEWCGRKLWLLKGAWHDEEQFWKAVDTFKSGVYSNTH